MSLRQLPIPCFLLMAVGCAGARAGRAYDPNDSRGIAHRAADAVRESRGGELPALRRWLIDSASQDDAETRVARLAILDALIQLRSVEGPETVVPCLGRGSLEQRAAIVLVVKFGTDAALLACLDACDAQRIGGEDEWLALGNALAMRRPTGFTFRLIARLVPELRVLVRDRTDTGGAWREPTGSVAGDGRSDIPPGFPPIGIYGIWPDHIRRAPLLIDGPRPIRFSRTVEDTEIGFGIVGGAFRRDDARLEWIAGLLQVEVSDLGITRTTARAFGPLSDPTFLSDVGFARKGVMRKVEALADRLRRAGLLSEAERAAVRPRVRVVVTDLRADATRPMATLPTEWTEPPSPPPPPPPFPETPPVPRTPR